MTQEPVKSEREAWYFRTLFVPKAVRLWQKEYALKKEWCANTNQEHNPTARIVLVTDQGFTLVFDPTHDNATKQTMIDFFGKQQGVVSVEQLREHENGE